MRLLVLGGTQFLGRAIAAHALGLGHAVTCAARGLSGAAPPGARFIAVDRDRADGLAGLARERFDAAVDVARNPDQVRRALAALDGRVGHWTFVSTTSVYADTVTRGQRADTAPLLAPAEDSPYGAAKVACERALSGGALICRAGLIVGPGDPTGRFPYWVARLARGGEVLAPAEPEDPVQLVDARDLAGWILRAAQGGLLGTYDAVAPACTRRAFLDRCAVALGGSYKITWVDPAFLDRHGVGRESGPFSLPLPLPDTIGDASRDVAPVLAAGLAPRPLEETARDTLRWLEAGGGSVTGLTAGEEAALLAAWHAERGQAPDPAPSTTAIPSSRLAPTRSCDAPPSLLAEGEVVPPNPAG
ncbi:Nucleoside-diphosphate-sugar epimerase [Methylobacterium sp. 174MFSha1.1]|uniref:NAD-dependent epimerase/dehydratase family protein n=1 Tax=Methylobacterium sp. 174MFSha1.1 TaxID=1502749 RepID=UPI0008EE5E76|nr:NAD-dependent epimerase/dehydratase family protein [Methylobacterium sp. 174MFSha1.1]SFU66532.1 Nucleoside-diphosphate-sugar epimerase [Methylobacterium sp. 174MFSha1.1]